MRNKIELEIEDTNPNETVLKNSNGDTFSFDRYSHEELTDFLHGADKLPIKTKLLSQNNEPNEKA